MFLHDKKETFILAIKLSGFTLYIRNRQYPHFGNREVRLVQEQLSESLSNLLCKNDHYRAPSNNGTTELIRNGGEGNNIRLLLHWCIHVFL